MKNGGLVLGEINKFGEKETKCVNSLGNNHRKTLIVSAFAGCGKTWLAENQGSIGYSMRDSDSSYYEKTQGWESEYVSNIVEHAKLGKYDFIFICQTESVLSEMDNRGIPYVIVEPDNIVWDEFEPNERKKQRQLIKQQWMGRLVLRNNSHIKDFDEWFGHIKEKYDERTSISFINRHKQLLFFTLNQDQYLSDVIDDLYWRKERYDLYTMYSDDC